MNSIDLNEIRQFYNDVESVWSEQDEWHMYSKKQILNFIGKCGFLENTYILNAGSGGSDYNLKYKQMLHVDIAENKIKDKEHYLVSSIENLPVSTNSFDNVICVGSVINYCDPMCAVSELSRVLKHSGYLILEFESSWGFEYAKCSNIYKQDAVVAKIEYLGEHHNQWLFSPKYIKGILKIHKFSIIKEHKFHILSGMFSKSKNDTESVKSAERFDKFMRFIPYTGNRANNIIYLCKKL